VSLADQTKTNVYVEDALQVAQLATRLAFVQHVARTYCNSNLSDTSARTNRQCGTQPLYLIAQLGGKAAAAVATPSMPGGSRGSSGAQHWNCHQQPVQHCAGLATGRYSSSSARYFAEARDSEECGSVGSMACSSLQAAAEHGRLIFQLLQQTLLGTDVGAPYYGCIWAVSSQIVLWMLEVVCDRSCATKECSSPTTCSAAVRMTQQPEESGARMGHSLITMHGRATIYPFSLSPCALYGALATALCVVLEKHPDVDPKLRSTQWAV
jgi:hypothetical protein